MNIQSAGIWKLLVVASVLMTDLALRGDDEHERVASGERTFWLGPDEINVAGSERTYWLGTDEIIVASGKRGFWLGPGGVSFFAWTAAHGLSGSDAEWNAKPALWGGVWANGLVYKYGEGLAEGSLTLMRIDFDADGNPVITTTPVIEGHYDFTPAVIGAPRVDGWTSPVVLENKSRDDWMLPAGKSANFFRLRLSQ